MYKYIGSAGVARAWERPQVVLVRAAAAAALHQALAHEP
jgi:hypothetical protein